MMKTSHLGILTLILIPLFLLNGACKTGHVKKNGPEAVAVRFMKHMGAFEFDEARKLGTDNTARMLDLLQTLVELSKEKGQEQILEKKDVNIEVLKVAVEKDAAVVTYRSEDGKEQTLNLVKEKGKWLVDMKKENPASGLPLGN